MKKLIFLFIAFLIIGCASKKNIATDNFVGIWKYPERSAWIEIKADNSVYQCRIDQEDKVISSKGLLVDNHIIWENV